MSDQHKPLTAEELKELRELEAKATPGPWRDDHRVGCVAIYPGKKVNCICESEETRIAYWHGAWVGENDGCWTVPEGVDANAALRARVEKLERVGTRLAKELNAQDTALGCLLDALDIDPEGTRIDIRSETSVVASMSIAELRTRAKAALAPMASP